MNATTRQWLNDAPELLRQFAQTEEDELSSIPICVTFFFKSGVRYFFFRWRFCISLMQSQLTLVKRAISLMVIFLCERDSTYLSNPLVYRTFSRGAKRKGKNRVN